MEILFIFLLFIGSMIVLVKGADWFLESSEKIGLRLGLSHFVVGALIVGLGTSLPELMTSLAAVFEGETEIVVANVVGSNVANILLVIGISAVIARRLTVTKSLIELDLPMLLGSSIIFLGAVFDGVVTYGEAVLLILAYGVYFLYTIFYREEDSKNDITGKAIPALKKKIQVITGDLKGKTGKNIKIRWTDTAKLFFGALGLVLGAKYLIESVIGFSVVFNISPALVSITAIAIGTSLPEAMVGIKAVMKGQTDMAIGNVFGSNIFNALLVVGIPGLFSTLSVDEKTLFIGVPVMMLATFLFVISGISRKIYIWEGSLFLLMYIFFIAKLFNLL